ncbi:hypothetical protein DPM33_03075 [Mesorhizobium hawassense]|uniref:Uncharacterized protein n=1 Tax=Mesorhizobium hawassense TaxID=1209954 RepID=A0A330HW48_9HYPH|nr:SAVED domain-containing protein [Mesorhizobium hawassense]RAZ92861.1 hypothetical protein DPM33_03075 [Mesorhizobium hawassense]
MILRKRAIAVEGDDTLPVVTARGIPELTRSTLAALSAGRCEFRGCNKFLFEHSLTKDPGNFSEAAHVVAFRAAGPRGDVADRPAEINNIENLMLLCAECHHNIDTHPEAFPREELLAHKREHEDRIRMLADLGPELRTNVLTLKSRIGERVVEIGKDEVVAALRPRYPASSQFHVVDLTDLGDEMDPDFYQFAARKLRERVRAVYVDGGPMNEVKHLSVFGLAPIPLLVVLGNALSNTVQTDLFQSHRDKADRWTWHAGEDSTKYAVDLVREGSVEDNVAVILSLSGAISEPALPLLVDETFWLYRLTLHGVAPNPGFLRTRGDLAAFRLAYRQLLADLVRRHPTHKVIHVFPAVAAPVAISLGFDLLPKAHPALAIYDFDKRVGGFAERIRVNHYE